MMLPPPSPLDSVPLCLQIRSRALQVLFKVLRTHGALFNATVWQIIYRGVLIPIFEDALRDEGEPSSSSSSAKPAGHRQVTNDFQLYSVGGADAQSSARAPNQQSQSQSQSQSQPQRRLSVGGDATASGDGENSSWIRTTCHAALSSLIDLFANYHATVRFLLPDLLGLVSNCIFQV